MKRWHTHTHTHTEASQPSSIKSASLNYIQTVDRVERDYCNAVNHLETEVQQQLAKDQCKTGPQSI